MNYLILFSLTVSVLSGIHGLKEACNKNSDCDTKASMCINGECNCDELSYYDNNQCLPYATSYGALCYQSDQCTWLGENSECSNNRCVCKKSFRWYRGECRPYVDKGEECSSDADCYNGYDLLSLSCKSGVCTCSQGYYDRGHDCRKSSTWLVDGDCALDIDCKSSLFPLVCNLGKCTRNETKTIVDNLSDLVVEEEKEEIEISTDPDDIEVISCAADDDCRDMANSLCDVENGACGCIQRTHYYHNGNCIFGLNACSSDDECETSNSECYKNTTCICKRGFFLRNRQCIAELGVVDPSRPVTQDSDCLIKPGKAVESACYCKNYWFNDEANRNCFKTMIQSSRTCLTNEWCYAMGPYAFCDSMTNECRCANYTSFNESSYYCEPINTPPTDICLRDTDCGINERCVDAACACLENFEKNEDSCVPNIDASCLITGCSHIGNSSCAGGQCRCNDNYIGKVIRCLKKAENLFDYCEEEEQCQNIDHAVCGISEDDDDVDDGEEEEEEPTDKKCVCGEDFTAVSDKCYQTKKYGDPCVTESECILVLNHSYQCRNSICQCPVGQKLKNGYCTSSSVKLSGSFMVLLVVVLSLGLK